MNDFVVELAALPLFVCTSATFIMAVLAMTPMVILIQCVVLMRSNAFKKPWSGVVETEGLIRKGSLYEVKFLHKGYDVHCEQEVSTSQKEASMFS